MNVLVMYDRQTESYWSQLLGEAVEGPLKGTRLNFVRSWFTTWDEWRTRYPDTVALAKSGAFGDRYANDYYSSNRTGIIPETIEDERLSAKTFVIGIADENGNAKAYSFDALWLDLLVNDTLGNQPLVIVYFPDADTGLVYERTLGIDGLTLTFSDFDPTTGHMIDDQTGSVWDAWQGIAVEGELDGDVLRRYPATRSFWFGWKDWYPDTEVYK